MNGQDETIKTCLRFDRGTIEPIEEKGGFLRARVTIARDGVFPYLWPDGKIRMEAKPSDELFSELTINSAKGAPVVDGHPPLTDSRGLITPKNFQKYVKGALGDSVIARDGHLDTTETVFDAALIADLKAGKKREVSVGIEMILDETPGIYNGQRYDAVQRNIKINHLAHVEAGRAGSSVRVHLDAADDENIAVMQIKHDENKEVLMDPKNPTKETAHDDGSFLRGFINFFSGLGRSRQDQAERQDGKIQQPDNLVKTQVNMSDAERALAGFFPSRNSPDKISEERDTIAYLKAQVSALTDALKEKEKMLNEALSPARLDAAISERTRLIDVARSIEPEFKHDGLSNNEIKLKVIDKVLPFPEGVKIDSAQDIEISARFEAAAALVREKASLDEESTGSSVSRLDAAEIQKKRSARLNMAETD